MVSTPTLSPYIPESTYGSKGNKVSWSGHGLDCRLQIAFSSFTLDSLVVRSLHVMDYANQSAMYNICALNSLV